MKYWLKVTIAFTPLLLVFWLVYGLNYGFMRATICVVAGVVISAIIVAWILFAYHILND